MSTSLHPARSITSHVNRFQNQPDLEERGARDSASPRCGTVSQGKNLRRCPSRAEPQQRQNWLTFLEVSGYDVTDRKVQFWNHASSRYRIPRLSACLRQIRKSCSVEKALGRHLRICQGLSKLSRLICLNQIISIMLRNISASTYWKMPQVSSSSNSRG